jgi:carbonic anhydrase/acetyltransferase-like protein (isoleucine patch superfamily)
VLGEVRGLRPVVHETAWIAPTAVVVGDVHLDAGSNIWYGAVLRAEDEAVRVGEGCNVQDGCVLHADRGFPCVLEAGVSLGHRAVVHGAHVESGALIGMGAIVLNGARVGAEAIVAAGAVVLPGTRVPAGALVAGVPGKVRREVTDEERADNRRRVADYQATAESHEAAIWMPQAEVKGQLGSWRSWCWESGCACC